MVQEHSIHFFLRRTRAYEKTINEIIATQLTVIKIQPESFMASSRVWNVPWILSKVSRPIEPWTPFAGLILFSPKDPGRRQFRADGTWPSSVDFRQHKWPHPTGAKPQKHPHPFCHLQRKPSSDLSVAPA